MRVSCRSEKRKSDVHLTRWLQVSDYLSLVRYFIYFLLYLSREKKWEESSLQHVFSLFLFFFFPFCCIYIFFSSQFILSFSLSRLSPSDSTWEKKKKPSSSAQDSRTKLLPSPSRKWREAKKIPAVPSSSSLCPCTFFSLSFGCQSPATHRISKWTTIIFKKEENSVVLNLKIYSPLVLSCRFDIWCEINNKPSPRKKSIFFFSFLKKFGCTSRRYDDRWVCS